MRIEGKWGRFDAPYVEVILICERLEIEGPVKCLIDTGASTTHILGSDAKRLKIDYSRLKKLEHGTTGIGGVVDTYAIPNVKLAFRTSEGIHKEEFKEVFVLKHSPRDREEDARIKMLPSLLGRDFLNRYKVFFNRAAGKAVITDEELP